jgi:hypothetical protein
MPKVLAEFFIKIPARADCFFLLIAFIVQLVSILILGRWKTRTCDSGWGHHTDAF